MKLPRPDRSKDGDVRGIRCPTCGCGHFRVVYTRGGWGGRVMRRRQCRHCGRRICTTERITGLESEAPQP